MKNFRFAEWLKLHEAGPVPTAGKLTPGQQVAQDVTAQALQKMPMKPGQKPADVMNDPRGQAEIVSQANKIAAQKGKPLNLGAVADTIDPSKVAPKQPGMM